MLTGCFSNDFRCFNTAFNGAVVVVYQLPYLTSFFASWSPISPVFPVGDRREREIFCRGFVSTAVLCVEIAAERGLPSAMRRPSDSDACRRTLSYQQVERLTDVVDSPLEVPGRGNYPTLKMSVRKLVEAVRRRLDTDNMAVNDVRINGGAASFIVIGDDDQVSHFMNAG